MNIINTVGDFRAVNYRNLLQEKHTICPKAKEELKEAVEELKEEAGVLKVSFITCSIVRLNVTERENI